MAGTMGDLGIGEWTLTAVIPQGNGDCMEHEIHAEPQDSGMKLKQRIEKVCHIPPEDMELFCKNNESNECKQKWLADDQTLEEQEVADGASIAVGVHGMSSAGGGPNDEPTIDPETGEEVSNDHVQTSIHHKGDASYYFAHGRKCDITEEQRIVSGGEPQMIAQGEEQVLSNSDPSHPGSTNFDFEDSGRPRKAIKSYAWGDEREVVKIYISKDGEPEAIQAAGDGKDGEVEVQFLQKSIRLVVHGKQHDLVLLLERIYYEIVPEECSFRVSLNKRISLTLKKKEAFTWLKLLKPE